MMRITIMVLTCMLGTKTVSAADAPQLGANLTYNGAEKTGTADGVIPAFTGGISLPPVGYKKGGDHIDPYAADKPVYTITAVNAAQYENRLSAGQLALLARHPETFRMDVYPTRRSCALPPFVQDETRENVTRAQLTNDGNHVEGARIGVPFPVTDNPIEIYWNHNFHWHGHSYHATTSGANVYSNGKETRIVREDWRYNLYADPQRSMDKLTNDQFRWMGIWHAPARFAGSGFAMTNKIDQVAEPRKGFMFRPDTRKIMRATPPAVTYDGPLSTSDGLRENHNMFVFSGAPNRYDWKLIGKRRIIVPYNAYKASATTTPREGLFTPNHLNPDYLRYEEHRVWVLEVTQKKGFNMKQARRVFYADEDSWIFLMADIYDEDDKLTLVQHAFIKNYYEAPACVFEFDVMHDVASGRYNVDHIKLDHGPADLDYPDLKEDDFSPSALRRKVGR